jgi:hypothetical protein
MARFSEEERKTIWDMQEAGVPVKRIAKHLDRQNSSLRRFIADHGGTRPTARDRRILIPRVAVERLFGSGDDYRLSGATVVAGPCCPTCGAGTPSSSVVPSRTRATCSAARRSSVAIPSVECRAIRMVDQPIRACFWLSGRIVA